MGLLFWIYGGTLLAVGLGIIGGVRSRVSACLGLAALAGGVLAGGMAPATAYLLLFGVAALFTVVVPLALVLAGMRGYGLGT